MKKYRDSYGKIYTIEELKKHYSEIKKETVDKLFPDTFERFLECALNKNGDLEEIAPDFDIENRRRWTATKIAAQSEMKYEEILNILQKYNIHGNWTLWEINNRPVDYDELTEMVEEELRR
jgi:hypothetical protein